MKRLFAAAPPGAVFLLGLLTIPAFLFQEKLLFRVVDGILFLALLVYSGKRIRPLPALILLASVTAAALLVPYGKVLTDIFGFPITKGALKMGLSRGILLLGLFYLSKFSVRRGLVFPGRIGAGIGKIFYYFEQFSENRQKISLKDLPGSLDSLLMSVSVPADASRGPSSRDEERRLPLIIPLAISTLCWVLLFL